MITVVFFKTKTILIPKIIFFILLLHSWNLYSYMEFTKLMPTILLVVTSAPVRLVNLGVA